MVAVEAVAAAAAVAVCGQQALIGRVLVSALARALAALVSAVLLARPALATLIQVRIQLQARWVLAPALTREAQAHLLRRLAGLARSEGLAHPEGLARNLNQN